VEVELSAAEVIADCTAKICCVLSPFTVTLITPPTVARATHEPEIEVFVAAFEAGAATRDATLPNKAITAVCAMRLSRDVFVDIDFLSLVVKKTFSFTAGKEKFFTS